MTAKYSFKSPEMIIAASALLVGLITAFVSIYSAFVDRAYARASVWPSVQLATNYFDNTYQHTVTNNGTGPALIKYAKVSFNGELLTTWDDFINKVGIKDVGYAQSHMGSTVLPAQKQIIAITITDKASVSQYFKQGQQLSIELCYCSIYDECWLVNRRNQIQQVEQCLINDDERFLQ